MAESFTGMGQFEAAHPNALSVAEELLRRAFLPTAAAYLAAGDLAALDAVQAALVPLATPGVVDGWVTEVRARIAAAPSP